MDSNVEVVANYLKALKEDKISKFDLIFPNITPVDFENRTYKFKGKTYSTTMKAELLSQKECQDLIFD